MNDITEDAIAALVRATFDRAAQLRNVPASTYRVQFHKNFGFRDAAAIVPYLADLGITHLYASPYLKAVPGSMHGYDVIDPRVLNPELGTAADYDALLAALRQHGMAHILDTVPNHMGVGTNENVFWNDVLENGPTSKYASYFDITWNGSPRASLHGRLLIPSLGSHYGEALEKGELKLDYRDGAFVVNYYDWTFPISPATYDAILDHRVDRVFGDGGPSQQLRNLIDACRTLPTPGNTAEALAGRHEQKEAVKSQLKELVESSDAVRRHVEHNVTAFNGTPGDAASYDPLDQLLTRQHYRLAYWKTAPDEINYRRFFDVNALAALQMEDERVFRDVHAFTLDLLADGKVAGLRIDHPDGLYDPASYFSRLQSHYLLAIAQRLVREDAAYRDANWQQLEPRLSKAFAKARTAQTSRDGDADPSPRWPLYVLGEKILAMDEPLPREWSLDGTSGYDFLNMTNGLFVDAANAERFTRLYESFTGQHQPFADLIYEKKKLILQMSLASELHMLALRLDDLAQRDRRSSDFTLGTLKMALTETIACFPVYRSYIAQQGEVSEVDATRIESAIEAAIKRNPTADAAVFHFIRDTLLLRFGQRFTESDRADQRRFAGKFQQLTSPTTAKGIEDTAFYIYNRLLSLNEVGGEPSHFGVSVEAVHAYFSQRQRDWPLAMSTLSTHDTKRSEDVRARLNVLSELPDEWQQRLQTWADLNAAHRTSVAGRPAPDRNDEYTVYQTLIGAWPVEMNGQQPRAEWESRVQAFLAKALREAKVHTAWTAPNADYEAAVERFVHGVLDEAASPAFLQSLSEFQQKVAHYGVLNSLSQTLLKLAAPGVPDTYQGSEQWDLSLVDPDNRRPVDYERRRASLARLREIREAGSAGSANLLAESIAQAADGRIKLYVHDVTLHARRSNPALFMQGEYVPLVASGHRAGHLFSFARTQGNQFAIVAVPRLTTALCGESEVPLGAVWGDTALTLPTIAAGRTFTNAFTREPVQVSRRGADPTVRADELFAKFPVALLLSDEPS